ncbi:MULTISPECIES: hypothetical protein [unclassified Bartonella]|uniref:hypothetical protein n=1 Tax=unclassified Bartonella TaxID=2645622 RepID=UPI0035CF5A1D
MTQKKSLKAAKSTRLHQLFATHLLTQNTKNKEHKIKLTMPCNHTSLAQIVPIFLFYAMWDAAIYESFSLLQKSSVSQNTAFL